MKIHSIIYGFDADSLFGNLEPHHFYDIKASADIYAELCGAELKRVYGDDVDVQIKYQIDPITNELLPNSVDTDLFDEDGYSLGANEIQVVDDICLGIQDDRKWPRQDARYSLSEASRVSGLPASIIRWACQNSLIDGVVRAERQYWFRQSDFAIFRRNLISHGDYSVVGITEIAPLQFSIHRCYADDVINRSIQELSSENNILIVQPLGLEYLPMLNADNSSLIVRLYDGTVRFQFDYFIETAPWYHENWSFEGFADMAVRNAHRCGLVDSEREIEPYAGRNYISAFSLIFPADKNNQSLNDYIAKCLATVNLVIQETRSLSPVPPQWDDIFLEDEDLFCLNYLELLLRRMGFLDVNYRGKRKREEYGNDFTFSEMSSLGRLRHYGLQAKRGDLSGEAGSLVDKIISQLDDAFTIAYFEPSDPATERYISEFIIAISGYFKNGAEKKIREKIPKVKQQYVHFWNGNKVRELAEKAFAPDHS